MVKVKLSLENYNKFVDFIGKEWVEDNYIKFLDNPNSISHPFIMTHSNILNSHKYNKDIIPKEIYNNILLKNYQKFNFIGSFIKKIKDKIPNPTRFQNDLKNPNQFEDTLFEIISFGILINSKYELGKKKEEENKGNPDFYINDKITDFTIECTRCNIPGDINEQSENASRFLTEIENYFDEIKCNSQIYLTTSQSFKDEYDNLFQLAKEVLNKKESGKFSYCNDCIIFYNTISHYEVDEEHEMKDFITEHPLLSMLPSNLGSSLFFKSNLKTVRNVREICINYEKDVYRKIRSTLLNKISKDQSIDPLPHHVFIMIPANFTTFYDIDNEKLKEELSELLKQSDRINSVFIIHERFYKDDNEIWGYRIEWNEVENENTELTTSHRISLNQFEYENYIVEEDGIKKDE